MTTATKEDLSQWMSCYMDILGFAHQRIQERINYSKKCSKAKDLSNKCITQNEAIEKIFVGSIREGIGMDYSNDIDILQINHAVICCDGNSITKNGKVKFMMEQKGVPAGYTLLKLMNKDIVSDTTYESLKYAIVETKRGKFLSSKLYMTKHDDVFQYGDGIISKRTRYRSPNGPSIPKYREKNWIEKYAQSILKLADQDMDFVRAFPCYEDNILNAWKSRNRNSCWPGEKTIEKVMSLPVHVVPVGREGSINEDLQWRISFSMAETHLIQTFNNTQTKVLVLMKLIAKHILQPLCSDITSYIVKTVMLWQAENIPQKEYCEQNLFPRLMDAVAFLKTAVEKRKLPSYMIPEKNLLQKKITTKEQRLILKKLTYLEDSGQEMVQDFLNGCLHKTDSILEISETLLKSDCINKVLCCALFCFTTSDLANYFTKMYKYRSWWSIWLYNAIFIWIPYFLTYGRKGFDPLSLELPHSITDSKQGQQDALKEQQIRIVNKPTLVKNVEQSDLQQNLDIPSKLDYFMMAFCLILIYYIVFIQLLPCIFLFIYKMICESDKEQNISELIYLNSEESVCEICLDTPQASNCI